MVSSDELDYRIAELIGEEYNPHWHKFTSDPEHAERLAEWLVQHGITPEVSGTSVTLRRGKTRLFCSAGDTVLIALAKAAVRLMDERPEILGRSAYGYPGWFLQGACDERSGKAVG